MQLQQQDTHGDKRRDGDHRHRRLALDLNPSLRGHIEERQGLAAQVSSEIQCPPEHYPDYAFPWKFDQKQRARGGRRREKPYRRHGDPGGEEHTGIRVCAGEVRCPAGEAGDAEIHREEAHARGEGEVAALPSLDSHKQSGRNVKEDQGERVRLTISTSGNL